MSQNISSVTNHQLGHLNIVADRESRKLHPKIIFKVNQTWGLLKVDLFASRLTNQLPVYFSWRPASQALATDAELVRKDLLCESLIELLLKILSEVSLQISIHNYVVIVAPVWKGQLCLVILLPYCSVLLISSFHQHVPYCLWSQSHLPSNPKNTIGCMALFREYSRTEKFQDKL